MFMIYIDVNSVVNHRLLNNDTNSNFLTLDFSLFDLYGIQEILNQPNLLKYVSSKFFQPSHWIFDFRILEFRLLVHSLCPNIYGHEVVKAALLMGLFGGRIRCDDNGVINKKCVLLYYLA